MRKKGFALLLAFLSMAGVQAQVMEPNLKWGKPTDEELQMTVYDGDTEANAVELYRSLDVYYGVLDDFKVYYSLKRRLKILKPEGKSEADLSIVYRENESNRTTCENVRGLKAIAYNLEDGKLVKTKMESSMIHEERLNKNEKVMKFSVPQVKVGTVIEYEYRIESDYYWDLRDWYAQSNIPVLYTRYELSYPKWFNFNIEETGVNKVEKKQTTGNLNLGEQSIVTNVITFEGRRLPALKKDNYVWNVRDYSNKVTHELGGINVPGRLYKNYTSTWDDIDKSLLGDEDFGGRLKKSSPFKSEIVAQGIASIPDQKERITAVFKLLKQKVRWNGDYAFWGKSTSKVLKEGTGSNADMNFLLINMLQDAGIESCPVVLRKRSSGILPLSHASSKYLTTFVVGIHDTDSTYLYLDGSVEDGYINVLPADLLVDRARVISKSGQGSWVDIRSHASGQESTTIQATLGADGLLTCKSRTLLANEAAAALRKKWRLAKDSADVIGDIQERQDIIIQNYQLNGKTDFSPRVSETMEFTRQCDATDDRIYVNPLILVPMKETPFKDETRELPVEFPYKQAETMNTMITLPEGYQVEEAPKPIILKADGLTVRIMGTVSDDNVVQMQYKMNLNKLFYSNTEYQDLKAFFDQVVEHNKNMLVVKKIAK